MKALRIIALIMAILMVASFAVACNGSGEDATTTTTTKKTTTTKPLPPPLDDEEPDPDPETPITGDEFEAWHYSFDPATIIGVTSDVTPYKAEEDVQYIMDQIDGFFVTDGDITKHAGTTTGAEANVIFEVAPGTKLVAYALVTGGDSASYQRTPGMWYVYGSNSADAAEDEWVMLDYVFDGATEDVNSTPFGYTIDEDKQGEYTFYKFQFTFGVSYSLTNYQLNELYLYVEGTDSET